MLFFSLDSIIFVVSKILEFKLKMSITPDFVREAHQLTRVFTTLWHSQFGISITIEKHYRRPYTIITTECSRYLHFTDAFITIENYHHHHHHFPVQFNSHALSLSLSFCDDDALLKWRLAFYNNGSAICKPNRCCLAIACSIEEYPNRSIHSTIFWCLSTAFIAFYLCLAWLGLLSHDIRICELWVRKCSQVQASNLLRLLRCFFAFLLRFVMTDPAIVLLSLIDRLNHLLSRWLPLKPR